MLGDPGTARSIPFPHSISPLLAIFGRAPLVLPGEVVVDRLGYRRESHRDIGREFLQVPSPQALGSPGASPIGLRSLTSRRAPRSTRSGAIQSRPPEVLPRPVAQLRLRRRRHRRAGLEAPTAGRLPPDQRGVPPDSKRLLHRLPVSAVRCEAPSTSSRLLDLGLGLLPGSSEWGTPGCSSSGQDLVPSLLFGGRRTPLDAVALGLPIPPVGRCAPGELFLCPSGGAVRWCPEQPGSVRGGGPWRSPFLAAFLPMSSPLGECPRSPGSAPARTGSRP